MVIKDDFLKLDPAKLLYDKHMSVLSHMFRPKVVMSGRAAVRGTFFPKEMTELETLYGKPPGKFWTDIPARTKAFKDRKWMREEYQPMIDDPMWKQEPAVMLDNPRRNYFSKEKFRDFMSEPFPAGM